jgi:hypothetical protein
MPDYRLYLMNPHSGHIEGVEEFHSGDDVEAILLVQGRQRSVPVELWCGARKVIHVDAPPEAVASRGASVRKPDRKPPKPEPRSAPAPKSGQDNAPEPAQDLKTAPGHKTAA